MRWLKRILLSIIIAVPALILLIYLLLWMPPVQQKVKDIALKEVMKMTGSKMSIGKLSFRPFNKLLLDEVQISDLQGDTLLYIGNLTAGFDPRQLLNNRLLIKSVELDHVIANIYRDSLNSPFNYQFLIDAFAPNDTAKSPKTSQMVIEIDDVKIKNGNIRYYISPEEISGAGLFDPNHIHLTDLDLEMQLKFIDPENMNIRLKRLAFKEKSGFELKNLQAGLKSGEKKLELENLILQLPLSEFKLKSFKLDYAGMEMNDIISNAAYALILGKSVIYPGDLKAFNPALDNLKDSLILTGKLEGRFPEINLSGLQASLGNALFLDISARMADFNHWKTSPLEININKLHLNEKGIKEIQNAQFQKIPNTGDVDLSGKITGTLPGFSLNLEASSGIAKLALTGKAGYVYDTGRSHADIRLDIDRFRYNNYTYKNVYVHGTYLNDSIHFNLVSQDRNVPLEISAFANLHPAKESVQLNAKINHLRLDTTNWLSSYPGAKLFAYVTADVKGFNPEKMKASLTLDSLSFKTGKNAFYDNRIQIDYTASDNDSKNLKVISDILDISLTGNFRLNTIGEGFLQTLSEYETFVFPVSKKSIKSTDQLIFNLNFKKPDSIEKAFELPFAITETGSIKGRYNARESSFGLQADIPGILFNNKKFDNTSINLRTDTILRKINLEASTQSYKTKTDSLNANLNIQTTGKGVNLAINFSDKTPQMYISGKLAADIYPEFDKKNKLQGAEINIQPGEFEINEQQFKLSASQISMFLTEEKYRIRNFSLAHSDIEYLKIEGDISKNSSDSLKLDISRFQLKTLSDIFKLNMNLNGEANGEIILKQLLTTPFVSTKGFSVKDIDIEGEKIGTINLISDWNNEIQGLMFKADLVRDSIRSLTIAGQAFPQKDMLQADINVRKISLDWLTPFTTGTLFGLSGELGASIKVAGSMKTPDLTGILFMNDANIGINMLNTQYKISDTIRISTNRIDINNLRITDENNQSALLNGYIKHQYFTSFDPQLKLNFKNFLVLNNAHQTDSLFYGNLRINGDANITSKEKNIELDARIANSNNSVIMITLPETTEEAQRYNSITFINTGEDSVQTSFTGDRTTTTPILPVKLNISLAVDPGLKLGAIINPQTKDAATVTGTGNIDFSYDMNNSKMVLFGIYTVKDGRCTLSLKNITKKSFSIREGGTLSFKGDPMSTAFNITAVYSTRADLAVLEKNFENIMSTTKIPVNAVLTVSGDFNKMNLKYDIEFPGEKEEIKHRADMLMYSDDIKIKEVAYLLAFNTFFPVNSSQTRNAGAGLWTSLASSTITSQLNHLLSGVLNENWSIGTELHTSDKNLSDMEMDVNVSTHLFDNRMTVNSNIGYRNASTGDNNNNFTGDFDIQLKLTKSGNVILRVYDITNNQYFEKAKRTQGVGVVYKKEARTFKNLFRKIKSVIK